MVIARGEFTVAELHDGVPEKFYRAWANSANGATSFSKTDSSNRSYLGTYVGLEDPSSYSQYNWSLIKGADGVSVVSMVEEYYYSTSSTTQTGGSWSTTYPSWVSGKYLWLRIKTNYSSGNPTYTKAMNVTGQSGSDGNNNFTWVKYADDEKGNGMSDIGTGKKFLGIAINKTTITESEIASDYQWSPMYDLEALDGVTLIDKTEILSGNPIFTDKSDDAVVHVGVDGKSEQIVLEGNQNLLSLASLASSNYINVANNGLSSWKFTGEPNTDYTLSTNVPIGAGNTYDVFFAHHPSTPSSATNGVALNTPRTVTTNASGVLEVSFRSTAVGSQYVNISAILNGTYWVKLEKSSIATPIPTPSPDYPSAINSLDKSFDIVSSVGKENLMADSNFNAGSDGWFSSPVASTLSNGVIKFVADGSNPGFSYLQKNIKLEKGEYVLTTKTKSSKPIDYRGFVNVNHTPMSSFGGDNEWIIKSLPFSVVDSSLTTTLRIYFSNPNATNGQSIEMDWVKLEKGSTATPYSIAPNEVSYNTQSPTLYKTNILLSEPLRSVGDVKDRLFLDTDGLWKVERNVKEVVFTGTENWTAGSVSTDTTKDGYEFSYGAINARDLDETLSNQFKATKLSNPPIGHLRLDTNLGSGWFTFATQKGLFTSVADMKTHLSKNNLIVLYRLLTPTIETLSAEQQTKLNNIQSFKESNYVYTVANVEPNLNAKFKSSGWYDKWKTEKELKDVTDSLSNLEDVTLPALSDGLLNKSEKESIKQSLNLIESEKKGLDSQYNSIYSNANLTGSPKTNLYNAKVAYNTAQTELKVAINAVLSVSENVRINATLITKVETEFREYGDVFATLKTRFEEALDAISGKKVGDVNTELGKVISRVNTAEQKITDTAITSTVRESTQYKNDLTGKVSTNEVISKINQSAESIQIEAKNVNFKGAVTFESFDTTTKTAIDAKATKNEVAIAQAAADAAKVEATTAKTNAATAQTAANTANSAASAAQSTADTANSTANTANNTANTAKTSATTANNLLTDLSSDSKLTPSEKKSAKKEWDIIVSEKVKIDTEATKYSIGAEKTTFGTQYNALNTYVTPLLADLSTTTDIVGATFRTNFKNYYDARQDVLNAITTTAKSLADTANSTANTAKTNAATAQTAANTANTAAASAQATANSATTSAASAKTAADAAQATANTATTNAATAQSTANSAQTAAGTANTLLNDLASDSSLTALEKRVIKKEWDIIVSEKVKIDAEATRYSISTEKATYNTQYTALSTYITPLLTSLTVSSAIVGTTFRTNFKNYYDARQDILNAITSKAKTLADAAATAASTAQSAANTAQTAANTANTAVGTINGKINNAVTTIDATGITVKDGSFYLQDDSSDMKYSVVAKSNLLRDHSFELIDYDVTASDAYGYNTITPNPDPIWLWQNIGSPKVYSAKGSNVGDGGLFGLVSAAANSTNYIRQCVPSMYKRQFTGSAFFTKAAQTAGGIPYISLELVDSSFTTKFSVAKAFTATVLGKISRYSLSMDIPTNITVLDTDLIRMTIKSSDTNWVLIDGTQLVEGLSPVLYEPETLLFDLMNGVKGSAANSLISKFANIDKINGVKSLSLLPNQYFANDSGLNANNSDIYNVNSLQFNDPGVNEGVSWTGGNGWGIFESPDALTNGAGNLQIAASTGRLFTFGTDGSFSFRQPGAVNFTQYGNMVAETGAGNWSLTDQWGKAQIQVYFKDAAAEPLVLNNDGTNYILSKAIYNRTYSNAANMYVTGNGVVGRSTSASKYKLNINEVNVDGYAEKILNLKVKSWFDKAASESNARYLELKETNPEEAEGIENIPVTANYGLIAEDVIEAGLEQFASYEYMDDGSKEVEGIQYERLWTLLIPIVKEQKRIIDSCGTVLWNGFDIIDEASIINIEQSIDGCMNGWALIFESNEPDEDGDIITYTEYISKNVISEKESSKHILSIGEDKVKLMIDKNSINGYERNKNNSVSLSRVVSW